MSDFSHRLKQLRLTHHLTQAELAKKLNVTQNAVHQWENRKTEPSAEMIEKIAAFFNVMPAFLMGWEYQGGGFYGKEAPEEMQKGFMERMTAYASELSRHMNSLNESGQKEAVRQVELLTKIPEYRKEDTPDES